jgi:plastocyanin
MNRNPRAALAMIAAAAAIAAVPVAVGASQQATAKPKQYTVKLRALSFSTRAIAAKPGQTVKFVWVEGTHNVVSSSGPAKVNSGAPTSRDKLTITLKKGTYKLYCVPHASVGMRMTIRVE